MKKHLFIFLSLSLISLWISCSDNNSDMAIESLAQTHWKGSYQNAGKTHDIILVFTGIKNGYFIFGEDSKKEDSFSYKKEDKILNFSCIQTDLLNGNWWIYKLTQKELVISQNPYDENNKKTLNLKRIY
ncbi:hypothetical protein [Proteiniphilum sp. UBA5384]|uniref:hypothetical protein n=1 Tax=Proteiniphilum sp. UBA5384 TaxID=1947279 RepID=UPI0025D9E551|nr:hypothetical protein [Proteiniphilum sp. UBA5384]